MAVRPEKYHRRLEKHQDASQASIDQAITLMELANSTAELFEKYPASDKRRLLDFLLSKSTLGNGELTVEFRQLYRVSVTR